MTDREIEKITEAFHGVMKESFGVDCKTHAEHHGFISRVRKRIDYSIKAVIWTLSSAAAIAVAYEIIKAVRG